MAGSDKIKGSSARLVTVPGYHLRPQYDLKHTRHLLEERKSKKRVFTLSLAPMVDMFSILVIYLLMNFSSSGEAFFISQDIVIPKATRGAPLRSLPLLSISKGKVVFAAENTNGSEPIIIEETNDGQVPRLREMLRKMKALEDQIGGPMENRGQVNLQADQKTEVEEVKKVMRVLIDEGWSGLNFVVDPSTEAAAQKL